MNTTPDVNLQIGNDKRFGAARLLVMQLVFIVAYLSLVVVSDFRDIDDGILIYLLSTVYAGYAGVMVWIWYRIRRAVLDPFMLFLLSAIVFNGGHMLLEVFHLNAEGIMRGRFSEATVVTTIAFVTVALSVFFFGASGASILTQLRIGQRSRTSEIVPDHTAGMFLVAVMLLLMGLPSWVAEQADNVSVVLEGGYIALYAKSDPTGLGAIPYILSRLIVPGAILLFLGARGSRVVQGIAICLIGVNAAVELFLGSRTYAMWPVLGMAWAYHRTVRPLPRALVIAGGAIVMFVVFPLVRSFRAVTGDNRLSLEYLLDSYLSVDNPVVAIVTEMGVSMRTVAYTLNLVPETRDFDHGMGYLFSLFTIIPNVFGDLHPTTARGTASDWLVHEVAPDIASHGGGFGFSFLAESYYNFGYVGGMIALVVIGGAMGWFYTWTTTSEDRLKIAAAAISLSFLTYFARGETASIVRPLVWYTLIPCLMVLSVTRVPLLSIEGRRITLAAWLDSVWKPFPHRATATIDDTPHSNSR